MSGVTCDVIVVGAGFAGATAARDLGDRGLEVLLLEAHDRVGGRTHSRPFRGRPEVTIETGGAYVNRAINPLVALEADRYGVELELDDEVEADGTGTPVIFTDGERRDVPIAMADLEVVEQLFTRVSAALQRFSAGPPVYDQPVSDLDTSAARFFAGIEMSARVKDLLYCTVGGMMGGHPDEGSMLLTLAKAAAYGSPFYFTAGGPSGSGYGSSKPRGGTGELVRAMIEDSGAELRLSTPVTHLTQESGRVTVGVEGGRSFAAKACVVAVPSNVLRDIEIDPGLSEDKQRLTCQAHLGRGIKTYMVVENVPPAPTALGMAPLHHVIPIRRLADGSWLTLGFGAPALVGERVDPSDRRQTEDALRWYFPDATVLACDGHDWNEDPYFKGAWRLDPAGTAFDGPRVMCEPEGMLFFAGADFDDSMWRVSIEGAVHSGHRAARQAVAALRAANGNRTESEDPSDA